MPKIPKDDINIIIDCDQSVPKQPIRQPLRKKQRRMGTIMRKLRISKKTYIRNTTKNCAYVFITNNPISCINKVKVDNIGEIEIENNGEYKVQEFRVAQNIEREVMLNSYRFYFTIFLNVEYKNNFGIIKNEWRLLYKNRQTSCSHLSLIHI